MASSQDRPGPGRSTGSGGAPPSGGSEGRRPAPPRDRRPPEGRPGQGPAGAQPDDRDRAERPSSDRAPGATSATGPTGPQRTAQRPSEPQRDDRRGPPSGASRRGRDSRGDRGFGQGPRGGASVGAVQDSQELRAELKDLVEYIVRGLVDSPDAVELRVFTQGDQILLELHVAREDLGRVIGRQGTTARAIRSVLFAAASRHHRRAMLNILED